MNRNLNQPSQMTRRARILERLMKLNVRQSNQAKCSLALFTQRKDALREALAFMARTTSQAEQLHSSLGTHNLLTARGVAASLVPYKLQKTTQLLTVTREHSSLSQHLCTLKNAESSLSTQLQRIQLQQLAIAEHLENSDIEDTRGSRQAITNPFQ